MRYKYFQLITRTGQVDSLYRCPDNDFEVFEQQLKDVEVYVPVDKTWRGHMREKLVSAELQGWWNEKQDQVSEERANEIIEWFADRLSSA